MGQFEEIQNIIKNLSPVFKTEIIDLNTTFGRILQEDIFADGDMPPFHKSAVDGFACHSEDLANELVVQETIQAGAVPAKTVGKNQCSKIMTGAMIPAGCDCVFMVEDAEKTEIGRASCRERV